MLIAKKGHDFVKKIYDWALEVSSHKQAIWFLAVISFAESSFFPIPPDVILIPMILARPSKAWFIAMVCTIASVMGGFFGYAIGNFLDESVASPILEFYGYLDEFSAFKEHYNKWGAWIVAAAGLTPFPYKVITIASGAVQLDLSVFTIASILSRGARFFIIAALLYKFGEPMKVFIEKRLGLLATLFIILLFGGFALLKFI